MQGNSFIPCILAFLGACSGPSTSSKEAGGLPPAAPLNQVVGIARVEPEGSIVQVSAPVSGIVFRVYKKENDSVKAGDLLLELDHGVESARVAQAQAQVETQEAQIDADQAAIQEYLVKKNHALQEAERLRRLLAAGAETQQAVDDAQSDLDTYQANIVRLQASVEVSRKRLQDLRASESVSVSEREQKMVRAPFAGKVLELTPKTGESVTAGQYFGQISPAGKIIASGEIDELFANRVAVGQRGWIRNLGSFDTLSTGTIFFASSFLKKKSLFTDQSGEKEDRRVREIKLYLDRPDGLLLNSRVECVIDISGKAQK